MELLKPYRRYRSISACEVEKWAKCSRGPAVRSGHGTADGDGTQTCTSRPSLSAAISAICGHSFFVGRAGSTMQNLGTLDDGIGSRWRVMPRANLQPCNPCSLGDMSNDLGKDALVVGDVPAGRRGVDLRWKELFHPAQWLGTLSWRARSQARPVGVSSVDHPAIRSHGCGLGAWHSCFWRGYSGDRRGREDRQSVRTHSRRARGGPVPILERGRC